MFDPRLTQWIRTFYAISVVQSGLTTGLMAYRIWQTDKRSATYRTNQESNLMPILRILIESASIQFIAEVILLSLYSANYNAQYMLLELITPLVVSPNSYSQWASSLKYSSSHRVLPSTPSPSESPFTSPRSFSPVITIAGAEAPHSLIVKLRWRLSALSLCAPCPSASA